MSPSNLSKLLMALVLSRLISFQNAKDLLLLETDKYEDLETPTWLDDLELYMGKSVSIWNGGNDL